MKIVTRVATIFYESEFFFERDSVILSYQSDNCFTWLLSFSQHTFAVVRKPLNVDVYWRFTKLTSSLLKFSNVMNQIFDA